MKKTQKNNKKTITLWEILQKIEMTTEENYVFFMQGFFDYCPLESKIKGRPIALEKAELPDTKETWQEIASMLASLIVLDCEKKEVKMTDFDIFIAENNITPENTPCSEHRLLRKAFLAGMRSQSERIKRILNKNKIVLKK